jgi:pimeloyl-ACP methyl ester carboxylesterase
MQPFRIHVPDSEIADLKRRLACARWPDDFANDDWGYGANGDFLQGLVDYWAGEYDWRLHEAAMNAVPNFRTEIDGIPIHFVHVRGKGPAPTPLLLTHGWPWTFWDFADVIGPLTDPASHGGRAEDAFDVVIPSLPGYIFSSPLRRTGVGPQATVGLWAKLMEALGYRRYGVHGGDFGAGVSAGLAQAYPDRVIGCHLIFPAMLDSGGWHAPPTHLRPGDYGPGEEDWAAHNVEMTDKTISHVTAHVHDGQTLAYAFNDSPVGLAAWLLVRRRNASDCGGDLLSCYTRDQLLTLVCLYWFTRTIGSSMRWYAETDRDRSLVGDARPPEEPVIKVPVAVAVFPREVRKWPRAYVERRVNLRRWTIMPRGGHYAPAEQPGAVVADLRAFFGQVRTGGEA